MSRGGGAEAGFSAFFIANKGVEGAISCHDTGDKYFVFPLAATWN